MRSLRRVAIAIPLIASAANAQTRPRTITGTVTDAANHKPLSQAMIFLGRTPTGSRTENDGKFRVSADSGPQIVMIRHRGYVPALVFLREGLADSADAGTTGLRQVKTVDDRAAVESVDVAVYPELARFYDHRTHYRMGLYYTPDELEQIRGSLVSLIREKANFQFICLDNRRHEYDCGAQIDRGRQSIMIDNPYSAQEKPCPAWLWTNARGQYRTLDEFQPNEVLAIEAFPNLASTPPDFAGSPCAVVMLWLKSGSDSVSVR